MLIDEGGACVGRGYYFLHWRVVGPPPAIVPKETGSFPALWGVND